MSILAIVFPGQASQKVGMLLELANQYTLFKETFNEASEVLGYDLWNLVRNGPAEELNKTYRAQPAILSASVSIWKIWKSEGGRMPTFMAGHSLGEYSALVCSGAMNFSDTIKLVELRGIFMQNVVKNDICAMSAIIGLNGDLVGSICDMVSSSDQIVSLSAFNSEDQVVISGHKQAVERVNSVCRKIGAKLAVLLPISVPSHCELMKPISEKLQDALDQVKVEIPSIPVINNVDVCIENDPIIIRQALVRQVYTPVRWKEIIEYLAQHNVEVLVEIGPGRILSTIAHSIISTLSTISVNSIFSLNTAIKY